jgi:zinc/manganese transport system substrate-binding protein
MIYRILFLLSLSSIAFSKPLQVVASFSILGDLVKQVGRDKVEVKTIVGRNGDSHMYEPTPTDVKQVNAADIVFINGLGFEGWIERLITASGFKGIVIVVGKNIHPRLVFEGRLVEDPHAWHSIPNAIVYIHNICDALGERDPCHKGFYEKNAADTIRRLNQIDAEMRQRLSDIPPKHRKIITAHDAFGYFGNSYGIEFLAPLGTNTESEPCAKDMVKLIEAIKRYGVKTIFLENITNPKLIQQLAHETKAKVGPVLYSDALSLVEGPASTYEAMMRYNFERFLEAMEAMKG